MADTPRSLIETLELVTKRREDVGAMELLGDTGARHMKRVRSIFDDPNIIGAGIAQKVTENETVDALGLCFYVRKKLPKSKVDRNHLLPPVMAGPNGEAIFTDVVALGTITAQPVNKRRTPIVSGYSVGHVDITAGTLGAIVRRAKSPKKRFLLSNAHVLANSGLAKRGDNILYPGPHDGGRDPDDIVAKLTDFVKFKDTEEFENEVDAALAEIVTSRLGNIDTAIHRARVPFKVKDPKRGMRVVKRGRTTGDTNSIVRDVNFKIDVDYEAAGVIGFRDQVLCDTYTKGGDSGSLIVEESTGAIVGLHFAGSSKGSVFTPIKTVMRALKFKF